LAELYEWAVVEALMRARRVRKSLMMIQQTGTEGFVGSRYCVPPR
jgi:hypothetical protein